MRRAGWWRPVLVFGLIVVVGGGVLYQTDLVGEVAYAFEKGRLKADFEHIGRIDASEVAVLEQLSKAFSVVAAAVTPSVVHISADYAHREGEGAGRRLFAPSRGTGSGVILDEEGHIVTNNHVVADARTVKVELSDGRRLTARTIGTDRQTDLAVIRIDADHLHPARLGDSDALKVGNIVLAIGSPFRLHHTVSHGIVSGLDRNDVLRDIDYQGFIQTDAPINPGNSGGPLINSRGEVVGINTAIATDSGGNQGVGFSIPSNTVRAVADALKKRGKMIRGYLGVEITEVTPELAGTYGMDRPRGAVVVGVSANGPAGRAGLRRDDVILEVDGVQIQTHPHLQRVVAGTQPGTEITLTILRQGKQRRVKATVDSQWEGFSTRSGIREPMRPPPPLSSQKPPKPAENDPDAEATDVLAKLGIEARTLSDALRRRYRLPESLEDGVVVMRLTPLGRGADAGLAPGQVIVEVDGKRVRDLADLEKALTPEAVAEGVRVWVTSADGGSHPIFLSDAR